MRGVTPIDHIEATQISWSLVKPDLPFLPLLQSRSFRVYSIVYSYLNSPRANIFMQNAFEAGTKNHPPLNQEYNLLSLPLSKWHKENLFGLYLSHPEFHSTKGH